MQMLQFLEAGEAFGVDFNTVTRWENSRTIQMKLAQRPLEQYCSEKKGRES